VIVRFTLNGDEVNANVVPATRLVDLLRDVFELTGTKVGCEEGECGACTVIVNGEAIDSCLYLAADVEGKGAGWRRCVGRSRKSVRRVRGSAVRILYARHDHAHVRIYTGE
jgi:hypothetical protein